MTSLLFSRSSVIAAAAMGGALALAACGGSSTLPPAASTTPAQPSTPQPPEGAAAAAAKKEAPPPSGTAADIHFPPIARANTATGLEVNTVALRGVPVVQVKLVIRTGSAADPADLPGVAQFVAEMLKEGTAKKNSAKIAETVDFLGARFGVSSDEEQISINIQALSDQLPQVLDLVAELATTPTFDEGELKKLKKRELDRLSLSSQSPNFLARREFWKALYGSHPYSHVDTTKDAVAKIKRADLQKWHQKYFTATNAYLVVVGDVASNDVVDQASKAFKAFAAKPVPGAEYPQPPARSAREVVLVDRPESVQSVIYVGNLALARRDPDYVPLLVANQVLGGSAASRMFMDLRERQSLTYGAYSDVDEGLVPVPFRAFAAVRNEVTAQAMKAFVNHLERITSELVPASELADAKRLLIDSFPLHIETPGEIAALVSELRTYGFPDNYWDGFRTEIQAVTPEQALAAAKKYIQPSKALIVVVGKAAAVKPFLDPYGPVKVLDTEGKVVVEDVKAEQPKVPPSAAAAPVASPPKAPHSGPAAPAAPAPAAAAPAAPPPAAGPAPKPAAAPPPPSAAGAAPAPAPASAAPKP
ncbi:MAG TPA: pitrilysin family protein [Polyangiales bacterium]|nr:pitrilysin family protein [Polyangiales bacterium]